MTIIEKNSTKSFVKKGIVRLFGCFTWRISSVTITSILSDTDVESLRALTFVVCFVRDSDTCAESLKVLTRCTVRWYELFSNKPKLTDDGNSQDFTEWSKRELFGSSIAYLASIAKVNDGGLTIYGKFHSDQRGDKTFMRFHVENGHHDQQDGDLWISLMRV